jgi:hypothetical protein
MLKGIYREQANPADQGCLRNYWAFLCTPIPPRCASWCFACIVMQAFLTWLFGNSVGYSTPHEHQEKIPRNWTTAAIWKRRLLPVVMLMTTTIVSLQTPMKESGFGITITTVLALMKLSKIHGTSEANCPTIPFDCLPLRWPRSFLPWHPSGQDSIDSVLVLGPTGPSTNTRIPPAGLASTGPWWERTPKPDKLGYGWWVAWAP